MARFLAVVVVLVVAALLVNRLTRDEVVQEPAGAESVVEGEVQGETESEVEGGKDSPPAEANSPVAEAEKLESEKLDSETDLKPEVASEPEVKFSPDVAPDVVVDLPAETVLLGEGDLLLGIPGEGELTSEQIKIWLGDPKNHVVLKPELPLGLAAGASAIQGIEENPLTRAKIELGRQLYFDTRLSSDNTISCASCHDPNFGYAKDTQFGVGVDGQEGGRNSPVAYNRILSGPQFWDGRAPTLEAQAVGPIENPIEMGNTHEACVATIQGIEGYVQQFDAVFGDGVNIDNVGKAIASFERAIVTGPAPWDYYEQVATFEKAYADDLEFIREEQAKDEPELEEEDLDTWKEYTELKAPLADHAISESAIRGGQLFFSDKAGCTACHFGANYADEKYHNLGVGMAADEPDLGRFVETKDEKERGAFKTPTVRNVSLTGPYMHDGSQQTLEEVVEWYAKGGHPNASLSDKVLKLELSDQDKKDLVEFMAKGLLGEFPKVETGRLPQ